jgi:lipoprotein-anchoring transpeptidase ErfK/SrfK
MRPARSLLAVLSALPLVAFAAPSSAAERQPATVAAVPAAEATKAPVALAAKNEQGFLTARLARDEDVPLYNAPRGRVIGHVARRTDLGSKRVLSVTKVRGGGEWLGVTVPERKTNRIAWVRNDAGRFAFARTQLWLKADRSARTLTLLRGSRALKRISVAVGRAGSPTPLGRFAVTDKLRGKDYGSYYGCCILALSAHQPHPPKGWTGEARMAIHGTNASGTVGMAASAGCLRAGDRALRYLMRKVPLGTPVVIGA